jgi:hypothetical protein
MPFDGTQTETPALRRAILVDALRHEMPKGFTWDNPPFSWSAGQGASNGDRVRSIAGPSTSRIAYSP